MQNSESTFGYSESTFRVRDERRKRHAKDGDVDEYEPLGLSNTFVIANALSKLSVVAGGVSKCSPESVRRESLCPNVGRR